jgi:hypothetical protein
MDTDTNMVTIDLGKIFGNFTMLDFDGVTFGGTNDVVAAWDGTLNTDVTDTNFNMTMGSDSDHPFFGFLWTAHDIRMFGPGTYMFDTSCSVAQIQSGVADCGGKPDEFLTLTVGPGQIGAHMLFDWNVTANVDIVNLYEAESMYINPDPRGALYQGDAGPTPPLDCIFEYASVDGDGDTVPGVRFIDGPFIGFRANFNLNFTRGCIYPDPVDLDIKQFRISKRINLGKKAVQISLVVRNQSAVDRSASALVSGIQNGIEVYRQAISVSDAPGNGSTRWDFPEFEPTVTGHIYWHAAIIDDNADDDSAFATTTVK